MYMSYCRFEGTLHEMRACLDTAREHINEEAEYPVSGNEITCFKSMVKEFVEFLQETEIIDCNGDLDEEVLDIICDQMERGEE